MDAFDLFKNIHKTNKEKLESKDCSNCVADLKNEDKCSKDPVSYTHLTLPTTPYV